MGRTDTCTFGGYSVRFCSQVHHLTNLNPVQISILGSFKLHLDFHLCSCECRVGVEAQQANVATRDFSSRSAHINLRILASNGCPVSCVRFCKGHFLNICVGSCTPCTVVQYPVYVHIHAQLG